MLKKLILSLVFLVFFISWTVRAQQHTTLKSSEENVLVRPLPKGISIYQLDNGMQVLLIENRALPMVGVNVVVKVGSAYETFASSGMSHMLEHLLFNGTTTRTQKQLYDDVDRIGGYNNANTSQFYTNYMMVTPAEHIKKGMEIQADMLFNSILPEEKFGKEKGIVLEEIARSLGNSSEQLERNINSILYPGHALSLPTLGTYATIEFMSRDAVNAFYHNNYVPNNMILSAIGNFRADSMLAWIKQYYGSAPPGVVKHEELPGWSTGFQKPHLEATYADSVYYRFYGGDDIKLQLFYPLPPGGSAEFLELLNLGLARQVDSLQSVVQAEYPDQVKSIQLNTRSSVLENYLQVTLNLLTGANTDELTRSVNRHLREMKFSISPDAVSAQAVKVRTNFLKNVEKPHMFGIFNADGFAIGGIESVLASYSGEGYSRAASQLKYLKISGRPLIIEQYPIARVEGAKVQAAGQSAMFEAQNGGATLIAKQNESSGLLAIHYLLKHKARFESQYGKDAARVLHSCLEERLKSDENQKLSNRFGFTYKFNDNPFFPMDNIYLHPDFGYIRVEGLADDLPGAIGFLNKQMAGFSPTQEEFDKVMKKTQRSMHMMGGDKAKKLFEKTYKSVIYEPRKYPPNDSSITYKNLLAFAKEYFQPANMIISVVSPAAPEQIRDLFSGFKSGAIPAAGYDEPAWDFTLRLPTEAVTMEKEGGGEQSYLFWGFVKEIEPADKPALKALSLVLADRIIFDIREKQGLAYRMRAGIEIRQNRALFFINMGTRPQNVQKLLPQYPGFFKAKLLDDLTVDELEKSLNMYLGRMMFRRLSSINQAYYLGHSFYFHGDMNYDSRFLEQLKNVSVDEVQQAARQYLKVSNPVSVVVR